MLRRSPLQAWIARILLAVSFFSWTAPLAADEPEPAVPNSEIRGTVLSPEGVSREGIEVYAYHLATEELFTATTNGKGDFRMTGLPYGYFDLAARSSDGLYVADQVANVSPTGKNVVKFQLQPFSGAVQADRRSFPGLEDDPVGVARVLDQREVGESFWRGPKGIAIIAGGAALVLLLIAGDSEPNASPFTP